MTIGYNQENCIFTLLSAHGGEIDVYKTFSLKIVSRNPIGLPSQVVSGHGERHRCKPRVYDPIYSSTREAEWIVKELGWSVSSVALNLSPYLMILLDPSYPCIGTV